MGVADLWDYRKGIDVFNALRDRLNDNIEIVLVGRNAEELASNKIITIDHTRDQKELAELYSSADLFVNPTRAEVFGMVNIESLACGTPVITFNSGGSPECIDETCGKVVKQNDIDEMINAIYYMIDKKRSISDKCIQRAKLFDNNVVIEEYIKLYNKILAGD